MERLSCTSTVGYNATEAAIHMARYQLAAPYARGKRVLDIACGEGYGAYTLSQYGALSVDGVDNSEQAIANARALFTRSDLRFHLHDAELVDELFPDARFDIIVCLETIEHLRDPEQFLRALKKVAADKSVIIITCPNDHWYYPDDDQSNPFHVSKYSFEAFRKLTTCVLGNASAWGYGSPVVGFGAVTDELVAGHDPLGGQTAMLGFRAQASSIMLPPRGFSNIGPRNCSYFVGVWGGDAPRIFTSAVVPISMDHYANLASWQAIQLSPARIGELESVRSALLSDKLGLEQQLVRAETELAAVQSKCESFENELANTILDAERAWDDATAALQQAGLEKRSELEHLRKQHAAELDSVAKEREHYRIQSFALAREFDLISAQVLKIGAERHGYAAELDAARQSAKTLTSERDGYAAELAAVRQLAMNLTVERDQYAAQLEAVRASLAAAQRSLRFLTKATLKEVRSRAVLRAKSSIVRPARALRPYLPAPALSLMQRIARALHI